MQEQDGSRPALRKLLVDCVLPSLRNPAGHHRNTLILAEGAGVGSVNCDKVESHHFPELCFCIAGEAEIRCGASLRQLRSGDVLVIPPQVAHSSPGPHSISRDPSSASSRLLWARTFPYGAVLNVCRTSGGIHRSTVHQVFLQRRIHPSVERLIEELQQEEFGHREMAACHLTEAFTWICRATDVAAAEVPESQAQLSAQSAAGSDTSLAGRTCRFIEESFDSRLDLEVISRAVGANKSRLCREFRRQYNTTVMEYLTRVRVDAAKRLLLAQMRVTDVAAFVGFPDPYHFSRVFKRIAGVSPKQFSEQRGDTTPAHPK